MQAVHSKYGTLKGIIQPTFYGDGSIRECMLNEYNEIIMPWGVLVPQYENNSVRKKYIPSLTFFKGGSLKSISLQQQTPVKTPIGEFPAELLTFYESGAVKRLFPLNGKISAYWTEENEYSLAEKYSFDFTPGGFQARIMGIYFYEDGAVKSITFWPKETIQIRCSLGSASIRTGISFYPDGNIKSFEPEELLRVKTPIGELTAYDAGCCGINGDSNSLSFHRDGAIRSLVTSTDIVSVVQNGRKYIYGPGFQPSLLEEDKQQVVPLKIEFEGGLVRFEGSHTAYEISQCSFSVRHYPQYLRLGCSDCSNCGLCG